MGRVVSSEHGRQRGLDRPPQRVAFSYGRVGLPGQGDGFGQIGLVGTIRCGERRGIREPGLKRACEIEQRGDMRLAAVGELPQRLP